MACFRRRINDEQQNNSFSRDRAVLNPRCFFFQKLKAPWLTVSSAYATSFVAGAFPLTSHSFLKDSTSCVLHPFWHCFLLVLLVQRIQDEASKIHQPLRGQRPDDHRGADPGFRCFQHVGHSGDGPGVST